MNHETITACLTTKWAGRELKYFDITDSTNNVADEAGLAGAPSGFLAVSDRQDAGRGRRGRTWISPSGYNIFMSTMVRPDLTMDKVSGLTLVMALAVSEGIRKVLTDLADKDSEDTSFSKIRPGIKWPNDIVLNGKKICGILTELHPMPGTEEYYVVIGVGINVNQPAELFSDEIKDMAGSVFSETGKEIDRSKLIAACMECFEKHYEKYVETGDLSMLKTEYEEQLLNRDAQVKVLDPKGEYEAVARGITDDGSLVVELSDGSIKNINAGEVSVRGLYGYV